MNIVSLYIHPNIRKFVKRFLKFHVLISGFTITSIFTYYLYSSLKFSIKQSENLIAINIKNRLVFEFEWRLLEKQTAAFVEFINGNMTMSEYNYISQPSIEKTIEDTTSIGWCPRVLPDERKMFVKKAKEEYRGILDYEITTGNGEGVLIDRPVDGEDMYPLLYSNPMPLTYIGLDFRIPPESIDEAIRSRVPITTNKIFLSFFGGLSFFVDKEFQPIEEDVNPIAFIVFNAIFDENDDVLGVIGHTFEPRRFILSIVNEFTGLVKGMDLLVFKRRNFYDQEYELLFDLTGEEEGNPFSTITIENSLKRGTFSYKEVHVDNEIDLDIVVILISNTKPDKVKYFTVILIGFIFTMGIWYINLDLRRMSKLNLKLSKAKSKFLAEMSHELRTPLNGILGMSDLLESENLTNSGGECIEDLKTCGTILLSTISEVLDFSKIESGKIQMNIRKVDIREFITNTMRIMKFYRTYKERKEEIKLRMYIDKLVPNVLISDFDKVSKIIFNFVGNSLKFTNTGNVSLHIYWDDISGNTETMYLGTDFLKLQRGEEIGYLRIVVKDTGRGMEPKDISNIFKPFKQVHNGMSSEGGTGLGLVISKAFIENMGGTVICESEINVGTTFTSRIKAKIYPFDGKYTRGHVLEEWIISSGKKEEIESISVGDKLVLVVDDVFINLRMMGKLLNTMNVPFHTASSGEQAIEMCINIKYDTILLDYFMGGMTGLEAASIIKSRGSNMNSNIFILTANEYDENIEKSGLGYIQKPVNRERLFEVIIK